MVSLSCCVAGCAGHAVIVMGSGFVPDDLAGIDHRVVGVADHPTINERQECC
jgi:hypothetical protein